jgi:hypothetical protein
VDLKSTNQPINKSENKMAAASAFLLLLLPVSYIKTAEILI